MIDVATFYIFAPLERPAELRGPLHALAVDAGVRGTVLVAPEGVNGTVAGPRAGVEAVLGFVRALPGCAALDVKWSAAEAMPFGRLKVRLKREIVTLGRPEADPTRAVGRYVEPEDWNALISAPDVAVIDTRNRYETGIGTFAGAIVPEIDSFRAFPAWWEAAAPRLANRPVAMFCTGGIRCEKSTAYLKALGVSEVYHLRGGILRYLERVPEAESLWRGECFVFDGRVALGHGLEPGRHDLCHACRGPVAPADRSHPDYEEGVCCPRCAGQFSEADRARFRERQRQMRLAAARGAVHLGPAAAE